MGIELPWVTRALLAFSLHARAWFWLYAAGLAGTLVLAYRWVSNPAHAKPVNRLQLSLPVVGSLMRNIVMTRVLRTLGALVSSGVPILQSLQLAGESAANAVFYDILGRVYKDASEGKGLSASLFNNPYIPDQVAQMMENGEKTGTLPDVLNKIADFYEDETDTALKNVFSILEPIFVLVLGGIVAAIAVAILLPVFKMNTASFGS